MTFTKNSRAWVFRDGTVECGVVTDVCEDIVGIIGDSTGYNWYYPKSMAFTTKAEALEARFNWALEQESQAWQDLYKARKTALEALQNWQEELKKERSNE